MDNSNDRYALVLLLYKGNKSVLDKYRIGKLEKKYPDNKSYQDAIIKELISRGLIEYKNSEIKQVENGTWEYIHPDLPKFNQTTQQGETALKSGLFPSESAQKSIDKRYRNIQLIGIAIAALGGLITILSFLYKWIFRQ